MMQNNAKKLKIAITGGYASGKSAVLQRFFEKGFLIYSADIIYNELLKNEDFVKQICDKLNIQPLIINGLITLNKKLVSEIVFNDREKLKILNEFTHKSVFEEIQRIFDNSTTNKIVFEIPLLFESHKELDFDIVIVVMKNATDRATVGACRDSISIEDANLRIKNQYNYDNIDKTTHTLIYNDSTLENLYDKVDKIIEDINEKIS